MHGPMAWESWHKRGFFLFSCDVKRFLDVFGVASFVVEKTSGCGEGKPGKPGQLLGSKNSHRNVRGDDTLQPPLQRCEGAYHVIIMYDSV